jgi:hypothetical protein
MRICSGIREAIHASGGAAEQRELLVERIAMTRPIQRAVPEVMVSVDYRELTEEVRLRRLLCQPSFVRPLDASPELRAVMRTLREW